MISNNEIKRIIEEEEESPSLEYKEELVLNNDTDKACFVKDIISLANSGEKAHLIVGLEDGTRKVVGIKKSYQVEQLNQILMDKTDPPLRIEYKEIKIIGYEVGVIEIDGSNPPYIVSVHDKYGGIERGTVFVRNFNMNEGARRADMDRIYERMKPVVLESDVHLDCEISEKPVEEAGELVEVTIGFKLMNYGDAIATDTYILIELKNIEKLIKCNGGWQDLRDANNGRNVISHLAAFPVVKPIQVKADSIVVQVKKEVKEINANVIVGASNMRTRNGECKIPIVEGSVGKIF